MLGQPGEDSSIIAYDERIFNPYNITTLGKNDEIRINLQNVPFAYPHKSSLYLEGEIGGFSETVKKAVVVKNWPAFLFQEIRLECNGIVVDTVRSPGVVSTLKNYLSVGVGETTSASEFAWSTSNTQEFKQTAPNFSLYIPMHRLLPLLEDHRKVIVFSKLELVLLRSKSDQDCFLGADSAVLSVNLKKVQWRVPLVSLDEGVKLKMMRILESGRELSIAYRASEYYELPAVKDSTQVVWQIKSSMGMERPLFVILGIQSNRRLVAEKDATVFDSADLRRAKLFLNQYAFPYENVDVDWKKEQFAMLYHMFLDFRRSYHGSSDDCAIDVKTFKEQCPIVVWNTQHMSPDIKTGPVDVRVELEFATALPESTVISAVILHEQVVHYQPLSGVVLRQI